MKKTIILLACLSLVMAACSKVERNEKKFLSEMQSDDYEKSAQAFDEFCKWLQNDRSTMTHDFSHMREQLGMKICTSPDGKLRTYSWITSGSENEAMYANVLQWTSGDDFVGYCGPLDFLLAGRKSDIKKRSSYVHSIDTIYQLEAGGRTIYLIAQSYLNQAGLKRSYVSGATIVGVQLSLLPNLFDGVEIAGNNEYADSSNTPVGQLFKWDPKARRFYAYVTDDNNRIIPGRYTVYELRDLQFKRLSPDQEN